MPTPSISVVKKDGRRWSGTSSPESAEVRYLIYPVAVGANEAMTYSGLPTYGSAHPTLTGLYAEKFDFEEGRDAEKNTLVCTVGYVRRTYESGGSGESAYSGVVEDWGWDGGSEEKELVTAADGTSVLNSAGDPFESVPQVSAPAPVFTKVIKFAQRQANAMSFNCKVNDQQMTVGDLTCPANTLMCTVSEKRIFGDPDFRYRYTIQLRFKSNLVKLQGEQAVSEIGWNVAVTDAGMREVDSATGKLKLIKQLDAETGKRCTVTSAELLNGQGAAVVRVPGGALPTPYNMKFSAYKTATFPNWFYSDPTN